MMNSRKPQVSDSNYIWVHGHKPRGIGYWAFELYYPRHANRPCQVWFAPPDLRFSDARAMAVQVAQERGAIQVQVGS